MHQNARHMPDQASCHICVMSLMPDALRLARSMCSRPPRRCAKQQAHCALRAGRRTICWIVSKPCCHFCRCRCCCCYIIIMSGPFGHLVPPMVCPDCNLCCLRARRRRSAALQSESHDPWPSPWVHPEGPKRVLRCILNSLAAFEVLHANAGGAVRVSLPMLACRRFETPWAKCCTR